MFHYHGTPITPAAVLSELAGRCFCISWAALANLARGHEIGQSVMLDNGALLDLAQGRPGEPAARQVASGGGGRVVRLPRLGRALT